MGYVRIQETANWFSLTEPIENIGSLLLFIASYFKISQVNVIGYPLALDITMQESDDPLKTIHKAHSGTHFNLTQQ